MPTSFEPSRRGKWSGGQPISELMSRALANPDLISLAAGFVDQATLPADDVREAIDAICQSTDSARAALQYGTTPGYPPLREAILSRHLASDRIARNGHSSAAESAASESIESLIVTSGSNQFLYLIADTLLDPGDIVLCAAPTYFVFLGILANVGARAVGVATDEQGLIADALEDQLRQFEQLGELDRVKAIYVVSYYDNPCGITTSMTRRHQILEVVDRWSIKSPIYVIEDEAYRDLRYDGPDIPSMRGFDREKVILAGTFSKCFSPGVRIGWGLMPSEMVQTVRDQKGNLDFGTSNFDQHVIHQVMERDLLEKHIQQLRKSYRVKRDTMLAAAQEVLARLEGVRWIDPRGGLYVWLRLPETIDAGPSGRLFERAIEKGVLYVPGQFCYAPYGEKIAKNTMRLSFGVQTPERIRAGMHSLADAIGEIVDHSSGVIRGQQ